ncbi:hypothetical protein CH289_07715 [Rhodococcus sp. RS1C4]|nr:alpha/beta fold hydrolase [Rhodococcus sp. RS1C4]OZC55073.1 hypothetical protein CH289_07715 [Rhodococcus sp. RS1C4]
MTTIIRNRGIGENQTRNMCSVTTDQTRTRWRIVENHYPAEYGIVPTLLGRSFDNSLTTGIRYANQRIDEAQDPVILIGFSAGAAVAGHTAAQLTPAQRRKVAAVILISDPFQPDGFTSAGHGIAGSRRINGVTARWIFDELDPICCTPKNSPLRTLADQTSSMSLADPHAWGTNLLTRLRLHQWQPVAPQGSDYAEARAAIDRYRTGYHTSYNTKRVPGMNVTYTKLAAQLIDEYA